ncbi:MAG: LPS-assembly protein LptD [Gammaproteobacteria bacterium]|jgi:LPS-assembly protein|nr:LPS-assembly protein LptD [Gammaproteobacteria bacterium]
METHDDETILLYGNVKLRREDQRILADEIVYHKPKSEIQARGNVTLESLDGDQFKTPELYMRLDSQTGYAESTTYRLGSNDARGSAGRIRLEGEGRIQLEDVRYTTCPKSHEDWYLRLGDLRVDKNRKVGSAHHATIKFKRVPIFYWPYLRFPVSDERESGFLMPEFGRSDKLGTELAVPYYWNIAPNFDTTVTPRILSKRGLQIRDEFRYLGRSLNGQLDFEFLEDDDETGEDRWAGRYVHSQALGRGWRAGIDFERVSDNDYLDDFGNKLSITSLTHLKQDADVGYDGSVWRFGARAVGFQTIDDTIAIADRPYDRLPQLSLSARPAITAGRLYPELDSELVDFERDNSLTGARLNLRPAVSLPFRNSYSFITPKLSVTHIAYDLDVSGSTEDKPDVTVPAFSLDSGLFFERPMRMRNGAFLQTLEPRVFYLKIPEKDQDTLPDFDTSVPDLSFANLFRENRFIGGDRVGDADQVTLALTTRVIGASDGIERLQVSLGRIFFFEDREVNLPAGVDTSDKSDIILDFTARLAERWYTRGTLQWNDERDERQKSDLFFQYQPADDRIVNLGQRFVRDEFEQLDLSVRWPLKPRWTIQAGTSYSLEDDRNLDTHAGLEYRSCCWGIRFFARRRISSDDEQVNSIQLQLTLNGLGEWGSAPDNPFEQSVFSPTAEFGRDRPGYR